jgi:hypothetical protein
VDPGVRAAQAGTGCDTPGAELLRRGPCDVVVNDAFRQRFSAKIRRAFKKKQR